MRRRTRFGIDLGLAVTSALLSALTLVVSDWIEVVLRVDPDAGSGALEWAIAGLLALGATGFGLAAGHQWRLATD